MFGIGPFEFGVVLVLALLIMGPKKLPELARTLGRGLAEFRRASNELRRSIDLDLPDHKIEPPPGPAQAGLEDRKLPKPKEKQASEAQAQEASPKESRGDVPSSPADGHGDGSEESIPVDTGRPPAREAEPGEQPPRKPDTHGD